MLDCGAAERELLLEDELEGLPSDAMFGLSWLVWLLRSFLLICAAGGGF